MVGRIDRINAESPESNYHEDANSLLRSLSFEAKPHLSRGGLAGVEGMAAPSRKRETDQVGANQLAIGTDSPIPWENYRIEHVMKTPKLTDEQRAGILGDNAAKLLKISLS